MSNAWSHNICEACWRKREPGREPAHLVEAETEECCYCGAENRDGIFVWDDPTTMLCFNRKRHKEDGQ